MNKRALNPVAQHNLPAPFQDLAVSGTVARTEVISELSSAGFSRLLLTHTSAMWLVEHLSASTVVLSQSRLVATVHMQELTFLQGILGKRLPILGL